MKNNLRTILLKEAKILLEKKGVKALTLRALALKAGVSHMAPYRHFVDKQALLSAIAANGFNSLEGAMKKASLGEPSEKQLLAVGVAYIDFAIKHKALYRLMFGTLNINNSDYPELVIARELSFLRCHQALRATYQSLEVDEDFIKQQALLLWALVHGYSSMMIDGAIDYPKNDKKALKEFLIQKLSIPLPSSENLKNSNE